MIKIIEDQIIQTENSHSHLIRDLHKVFYEPLQEYFESYVIFKYIKELNDLHSHIRTVYQFSYSDCTMFKSRKSEFIFYYSLFFENLPRAFRYLQRFLSNDTYKEALQDCLNQSNEDHNYLENQLYSLQPWIVKMKTLFDFLKTSDPNYDVEEISNMYAQLMKIYDKTKEDHDMINKIEKIEERFAQPVYFQEYGTLWIQNELKVHIHESNTTGMKHLFLFDQVLVMATKKSEKLIIESIFNFYDDPIYGNSSSEKLICMVCNKQKTITLYFSSSDLFNKWKAAIENSLWKTRSKTNRSLKTKTVFGFYRCFNCDSLLTGVYHQAICDTNSESAKVCDKACLDVEFPTQISQADKRAAVICELIETEKVLVDSIEVLLWHYKPIFQQNHQTDDLKNCYECLRKLFLVHDSFLDELMHKCGLHISSVINYADMFELFKRHEDDLLIHGDYVVLFDRVNEIFNNNNRLIEESKKYEGLTGKFKKYDIKNLLARPFQRIPRYKLILEQLRSYDFVESEVLASLNEAVEAISEVNAHSNAMKADDCFEKEMHNLSQQIINMEMNGNHFMSYGRLRKQGEVKLSFERRSAKLYHVFVFDILIIITKLIENSKYRFYTACRLRKPMIKPNLQDFKLTLHCEMDGSSQQLVFHCDSKTATFEWYQAINLAIDTMYPAGHNQDGCSYFLTTIPPRERCFVCHKIFYGSYLQGYECSINKTYIHKTCMDKINSDVSKEPMVNHSKKRKHESKLLTLLRSNRKHSCSDIQSIVTKQEFPVLKSLPIDCIEQFLNSFSRVVDQFEMVYEETKQYSCGRMLSGHESENFSKVVEHLSKSHRDLINLLFSLVRTKPQSHLHSSQESFCSLNEDSPTNHPKQDFDLYSETVEPIIHFLEDNILNYGFYVALALTPDKLVEVGVLGLCNVSENCQIHEMKESCLTEPVKSLLSLRLNFETIQTIFHESDSNELQAKISKDVIRLDKIFEFIQTMIDDFDELLKLTQLEQKLDNLNLSKNTRLYDYGKLHEEGMLLVNIVSEKLPKKRQIYVFDQILLLAVKQGTTLVYDTSFNIEQEQVEVKKIQDGKYSIQLFVSKRGFRDHIILHFDSKVLCKKWEAVFNIAINNTFTNERVMKLGLKSFESFEKCSLCEEYLIGAYRQGYCNKETGMAFHFTCVQFKNAGTMNYSIYYRRNLSNTKQFSNCSNENHVCCSDTVQKPSITEPMQTKYRQKRNEKSRSRSRRAIQYDQCLGPE